MAITINNKNYDEDKLDQSVKNSIAQIQMLQKRMNELQMDFDNRGEGNPELLTLPELQVKAAVEHKASQGYDILLSCLVEAKSHCCDDVEALARLDCRDWRPPWQIILEKMEWVVCLVGVLSLGRTHGQIAQPIARQVHCCSHNQGAYRHCHWPDFWSDSHHERPSTVEVMGVHPNYHTSQLLRCCAKRRLRRPKDLTAFS